jgi:hypothetical protein
MPVSPSFPSIPMPTDDPRALYNTCMVLKQAVEDLQGANRSTGYAARMFVQDTPPDIIRDGDFWMTTGTSTTLSLSIGGVWRRAGTLV